MAETYDLLFKLVLIGDNNVGKSAILQRFVEGSFTHCTPATIGM